MAILEIEIEQSAVVSQSTQISLASTPTSDSDSNVRIKLTIGGGNVFHPNARITLVPPIVNTEDANGTGAQDITIAVRIGPNNLFEEESHSIFDLSSSSKTNTNDNDDGNDNDNDNGNDILNIVGSYNQFAARSHLQCESIGNANIFNPKCNISIPLIRNGNIFQSCAQVKVLQEGQGGQGQGHGHGRQQQQPSYQEQVCYQFSGPGQDEKICKQRNHINGVKKNIMEVSLLLSASRRVVQKYHRLMAVKSQE